VRIKAILLILAAASLVAAPIYFVPRNIVINSFTCDNQFGPCSDTMVQKIDENKGKSLLSARKNVEDFLASEPLISDYSTHYKIPDKLEINVLLRKPYFGISFNNSEATALIDEEGYVLAFREDSSLPVLEALEAPPQVGEKVAERRLFALKLLGDMYDYYQIKIAKEQVNGVVFEMEGSKMVIFPYEGDRQILIASLAVILTRLNAGDSSTRIENVEGLISTCLQGCTIDLRYKNPVIR
jgi:hypothetical protein